MRIRSVLSQLRRRLIRRPIEAALHPSRRRAVLRRIQERQAGTRSVLFVCHGNICRSPYAAEALIASLLREPGPRIEVWSAGFLESGREAPATAVAAAARRGVDLRRHRSQKIDPNRVRAADLVVVMDTFQAWKVRSLFGKPRDDVVILADLLSSFRGARMIPDPIDQPLETFERVYTQIDECLAALRSALRAGGRR